MTSKRAAVGLVVWISVCYAAAAIGSASTTRSVAEWYPTLARPAWTPPNAIFGPVWSVLYLLMAIAAWLVWRQGGFRAQRGPLALFVAQLALNIAWSIIFFGLRRPGLAFAEIVVLWALILATTIAFWRVRPLAGWLLVPYLAWVSFASALNFALWRLNP